MNREELLKELDHLAKSKKEDHATYCAMFTIVEQLCPSLMSTMPSEGNTFGVWMLQDDKPSFEEDRDLLNSILPGHYVIGMSGVIRERGHPPDPLKYDEGMNKEEFLKELDRLARNQKEDHSTNCAMFTILKKLCPSLRNTMPDEDDSFGVWMLQEDMPTFEDDRDLIRLHLPGHCVWECGLAWQGGPPTDPLEYDKDMLRYYSQRGEEVKIFKRTLEILKRRCPSLTEGMCRTPPLWKLDADHPQAHDDKKFIASNLPGHEVRLCRPYIPGHNDTHDADDFFGGTKTLEGTGKRSMCCLM